MCEFDRNVVIVSNSAGTNDDHDFKQANEIEQALGVRVLHHSQKKPAGDGELMAALSGVKGEQVIVVGDRLFTDVVFGHRIGALCIHTEPFTEEGDNRPALLIRRLETKLLSWWLGTRKSKNPPSPKVRGVSIVSDHPLSHPLCEHLTSVLRPATASASGT